jgi:hypothetical protein
MEEPNFRTTTSAAGAGSAVGLEAGFSTTARWGALGIGVFRSVWGWVQGKKKPAGPGPGGSGLAEGLSIPVR